MRFTIRAAGALRSMCFSVLACATLPSNLLANDLKVETAAVDRVVGSNTVRVTAKVSWKNAWRNTRNYDAAWLFVKFRTAPNAPWRHARIASTPRAANAPISCEPSADHVCTFCRAAAPTHRGDLTGDVVLELYPSSLPNNMPASASIEVRVFGIA